MGQTTNSATTLDTINKTRSKDSANATEGNDNSPRQTRTEKPALGSGEHISFIMSHPAHSKECHVEERQIRKHAILSSYCLDNFVLDLQCMQTPVATRGDRESALLFQARAGSLAMQQRRWELLDADPSCRLCGAIKETIQHIIMDCPRLGAREHPHLSLAEYLGSSDDSVDI
ncbi:hypothetical protein HPB51_001413 [Rhipicephalus microplus]|uniref:Tick transposon n=1 Tax=Rhipicephalus microplus TaxID=6941 RepID=A0A9J6EE36_RHIMP|nr:hypothetical protein HPB51_001413 [Rhipicephalus microplus]